MPNNKRDIKAEMEEALKVFKDTSISLGFNNQVIYASDGEDQLLSIEVNNINCIKVLIENCLITVAKQTSEVKLADLILSVLEATNFTARLYLKNEHNLIPINLN